MNHIFKHFLLYSYILNHFLLIHLKIRSKIIWKLSIFIKLVHFWHNLLYFYILNHFYRFQLQSILKMRNQLHVAMLATDGKTRAIHQRASAATKHKAALLHARFAWCSPDVSNVLYSYVCLSGIAALWPVPQCQRVISCRSGSIFTTLLYWLVIPWISFESNTPFHKQANFFL